MHTHNDYSDGASCSFLCRRIHSMAARSPKLPQEILDFDEDLALQLENLKPIQADGAKVLNFSWLSRVLTVALKKHIEAVDLIPPLDFPLLVHDEAWMNEFMDQTARMLDVCNALTGALSNIEQSHLLIRHACHVLLDSEDTSLRNEVQSSDEHVVVSEAVLERAHKSLHEWVSLQALMEQRSPKYSHLLKAMIQDLRPPRDRDLIKGKGFVHALYGANVTAVFAFYVLALAFLREGEIFSLALPISLTAPWSQSISHLVQVAKDEARENGSFNVRAEDMIAFHTSVKDLTTLVEQLCKLKDGFIPEDERTALARAVSDLCLQMDEIEKGLQFLRTTLNDMLKAIVSSRTVLLDRLGDFATENL